MTAGIGFEARRNAQTRGSPGPRGARGPLRPGAAGRLAAELERRCHAAIELRARGSCVGMLMGERRHSRGGHDAGCRTLGVPLRGLRRFLKAADHAGAAALLDEALTAAVSEIVDWGDAWSASSAAEAVSAAIRVRITPHDGASHEVTHTR